MDREAMIQARVKELMEIEQEAQQRVRAQVGSGTGVAVAAGVARRAAPVRRVSNSQAVRVRGARCSTQDVYCCDSDSSSGSSYGNYRRRRARRFSNRCCDTRVQRSWPFWPGTCAPLPPAYIVPNACSPICLPGGPIFPCDVTAAVVTETMCRLP